MATPRRKDQERPRQIVDTPSTVPIATDGIPAAVEYFARTTSPDEIARRAYELFELRGGEPGRELDDWVQAERGL